MAIPRPIWNQLRSLTAGSLIKALKADHWQEDVKIGAKRAFRKGPDRRLVIHYHPQKTYGPKLLTNLLKDTGWTEDDMRRLKLIK